MNDHRKMAATPDRSALDWAREAGVGDEVMRRTETRVRRRRGRYATIGAAVVGLILVGLVKTDLPGPPSNIAKLPQLSASVSRPLQRVLPDGSVVELKPDAVMTVDFSGSRRRVDLKRGEAHFEIAKDATRPFIVAAAGVEVRAVGTAFSVGVAQASVEVLVTEGRVSVLSAPMVRPSAELPVTPIYVDAGNRAVVAVASTVAAVTTPHVSPISKTELSERLSWRVPRLEFVGTPLAEAIPMFNEHSIRWHGARIVLGDSELGRLQLSGILRADNTDTLLRVLATEFGIRAERRNADLIVLRKN